MYPPDMDDSQMAEAVMHTPVLTDDPLICL